MEKILQQTAKLEEKFKQINKQQQKKNVVVYH